MMRKILSAAAVALWLFVPGTQSAAQSCSGQFQAGQVCGNSGASQAPPGANTLSPLLDRNFGAPSASGTILNRGASVWSATATPTLGASGTLGSLSFGNATSGFVTLNTVAGALGTVTASLPANTGTIAELNLIQTYTALQTFNGGAIAPTRSLNDNTTNVATTAYLFNSLVGVDQNILNTQTTNYSIASTDCGKTVQAGTGSTGFFTITLPAVGGFPANCTVTVKNSDTIRAKGLSGFPSNMSIKLWPLQSVTVKIINGAWATTVNPGRFRITGGITIFVDGSVGNDSNDGLAAGSSNALLTFAAAAAFVTDNIDASGNNVTIQLASGQTWTNLTFAGGLSGGGTVVLDGGNGTITGSANNGLLVYGNIAGSPSSSTTLQVQNVTFTCSGGGNGIVAANGITALLSGVTFGSCPGGIHKLSDSKTGRLASINNYTISGGAARHIAATSGGHLDDDTAITVTLTGTPAFSGSFAFADTGSLITVLNVTYSGAATGIRYQAGNGSVITTGAAGPNYFPGNAAGFVISGGGYDSPGTPSVSSCGTSPGSPVGSDQAGHVTEGTTATGCVVTFTTQNGSNACSVSSSSATVQAGLVISSLSSAALTVAHPAASNPVLYWTCPPQ